MFKITLLRPHTQNWSHFKVTNDVDLGQSGEIHIVKDFEEKFLISGDLSV